MDIKTFSKAFEPQKMGNIADLKLVKTDVEIHEETRKDMNNEDYKVMFIIQEGIEYRVPISVIEQLKAIVESKPDLTMFKVSRTGSGMATKYQVIPL